MVAPNYYTFINQIEWYDDEYITFDECIKFTYTKTSSNAFNMTLDLKDGSDDYSPQQYLGSGFVDGGLLIDTLFTVGKLRTAFNPGQPTRANNHILATDYLNYAFVWDCSNLNATHYNEKMWYFDRNPLPSKRPKEVDNLMQYFNTDYIRKTIQNQCDW